MSSNIKLSLCIDKKIDEIVPDNLNVNFDYNHESIIAAVYSTNKKQKNEDIEYSNKLYSEVLKLLSDLLNKFHGTHWLKSEWEILIGHFLIRSSRAFTNRYKGLQNILSLNNVTHIRVAKNNLALMSAQNSYQSIWKFSDPYWNEQIYSYLAPKMYKGKIYINQEIVTANDFSIKKTFKTNLKKAIKKFAILFRVFQRKDNIFLDNLYLNFLDNFKINYSLKQFPQFYYEEYIPENKEYDEYSRKKLIEQIPYLFEKDIYYLVEIIILSLPRCFIEDYKSLYNQAITVNWPSQPKSIITSNSFDTHDLFKMWTIIKRRQKSNYIVLQHGASYGTDILSKPSVEEKTADKFLTWGWTTEDKKYVRGGMQISKYSFKNKKNSEKMLLIQRALMQKVRTYDVNYEYYQNFNKQKKFIEDLDEGIRQKLDIRLQSDWTHHNFNDFQRWSNIIGKDAIDIGLERLDKSYKKYGLLIFTYESSGFLQALSGNFPTIAIWKDVLAFASTEVNEHYYRMLEVGLIYENYSDLAKFLNSTNIKLWWSSEKVQTVKNEFIKEFCSERSMIAVLLNELR